MVELIKTSDQCPWRFNFGDFFQLRNPPYFLLGKNQIFRKRCSRGMGGNDKNLGRVLLGGMSKNAQIKFFDSQMYLFASNSNTINLKLFRNCGRTCKFRKKSKKESKEKNLFRSQLRRTKLVTDSIPADISTSDQRCFNVVDQR